ncbi:MAG: hypothetical protein CMI28_04140 [Opitutae bacterium]|nr:hypothetical protein [Opitutae bacterium]HAD20786.1 hypothetical protein [Opitutae bacterium]
MKDTFSNSKLGSCLVSRGPLRELFIASFGCFIGTTLLLLAIQIYQDATIYLENNEGPKNYFTINKKIEGGALLNLAKKEESFDKKDLDTIRQLTGVKRIGGFVRNKFPITLYIWPSGKIGFGAAAKTDLFFESIPDEFLDFIPKEWEWEENASIVPIMVPKFYLDLWNFGLAPSRVEYPALSTDAARGMPIEIFIGKNKETTLNGRFVAFSKRINSVLVPESFLNWANQKFAQPDSGDFYFLWKEGNIDGPPRSRSELSKLQTLPDFKSWEISPLGNPASRSSISSLLQKQDSDNEPSRIILEIADTPSPALLEYIDRNEYELNREFPDQDLIKKALQGIFAGVIGIGILLSLLSIATFASSFKLVVSQSSEHVKNLLLLGFSPGQISQIFYRRFQKLFIYIISGSLVVCFLSKYFLGQTAIEFGINIESNLSGYTVVFTVLYSIVFLVVNKTNISNSVLKLDK